MDEVLRQSGRQSRGEGEHGSSAIYRQAGRQSTRRGGEGREGRPQGEGEGEGEGGGGGTTNSMGISNGAERGTRECPRAKGNPFLTQL